MFPCFRAYPRCLCSLFFVTEIFAIVATRISHPLAISSLLNVQQSTPSARMMLAFGISCHRGTCPEPRGVGTIGTTRRFSYGRQRIATQLRLKTDCWQVLPLRLCGMAHHSDSAARVNLAVCIGQYAQSTPEVRSSMHPLSSLVLGPGLAWSDRFVSCGLMPWSPPSPESHHPPPPTPHPQHLVRYPLSIFACPPCPQKIIKSHGGRRASGLKLPTLHILRTWRGSLHTSLTLRPPWCIRFIS